MKLSSTNNLLDSSNNDDYHNQSHLSPTTNKNESSSIILMNKQIELIHPLEHQWSFWYLKNQQGKDWQDNLMKLATFAYVEEFWA